MTTTYDPKHDLYVDEADVRGEMARVFDVCNGCRRCVDLCPSFPTLFEMLDAMTEPDAGSMTPAQQDQVVGGCFQCSLCVVGCPYRPGVNEAEVDMPRLMLRAVAMQRASGHQPSRSTIAAHVVGQTELMGSMSSRIAPFVNRIIGAKPGSLLRRLVAKLTGITATRRIPEFAGERFSTWFERRPRITIQKRQATATVFPTCLVEYQAVDVGQDLVKVYERNGIECRTSGADCCGAMWLHAGDVDRFSKIADRNVTRLAAEIRSGTDVVVPEPACASIIRTHYPDYVSASRRAEAELVASKTYDAAGYLMSLHRGDDYVLDTDFDGLIPRSITYHTPTHLGGVGGGLPGRDLMRLTGARISLVQQSAGISSTWGYRVAGDAAGAKAARRLGERIEQSSNEVVAGDGHLANTVIAEKTGVRAVHPVQVIARAYGIHGES